MVRHATCLSARYDGVGSVALRQPPLRDRAAVADDPGHIRFRFSSMILPRSKSIETLLPILYLKGISNDDFPEVLAALLGKDESGLSASVISRRKEGFARRQSR